MVPLGFYDVEHWRYVYYIILLVSAAPRSELWQCLGFKWMKQVEVVLLRISSPPELNWIHMSVILYNMYKSIVARANNWTECFFFKYRRDSLVNVHYGPMKLYQPTQFKLLKPNQLLISYIIGIHKFSLYSYYLHLSLLVLTMELNKSYIWVFINKYINYIVKTQPNLNNRIFW